MQENKFERDVQQKMEELRFEPSAPAWEAVSRQINEKRRRRRVLLLWFFFGILLIGGGVLLLQRRTAPETMTAQSSSATPKAGSQEDRTGTPPAHTNTVTPAPASAANPTEIATSNEAEGNNSAPATGTDTRTFQTRSTTPVAGGPALLVAESKHVRNNALRHPAAGTKRPARRQRSFSETTSGAGDFKNYSTRTPGNPRQSLAEALKTLTGHAAQWNNTSRAAEKEKGLTALTQNIARHLPAVAPQLTIMNPPATDSIASAQPARKRLRPEWSIGAWAGAGGLSKAHGGAMAAGGSTSTPGITPADPTYTAGVAGGFRAGLALPVYRKLAFTAQIGYAYYSVQGQVSDYYPGNTVPGSGLLPAVVTGPISWKSSARYTWHYVTAGAGLRWKPLARLQISTGLDLALPVAREGWVYSYDDRSFVPETSEARSQVLLQLGAEYRVWQKGGSALYVGMGYQRSLTRTGPGNGFRFSVPGIQAHFRF